MHPTRPLSPLEARVLGVLIEKQHTVPDSYPLSLNALTLGCNQKTAREPVMNASEAEVLSAINGLRELSLVHEVSGSRVTRFDHNAGRGLGVPGQSVALLAMLMLRGPQTAAELRLHTERLHRFADISSVEGFLNELAEREPHRVAKLARAPGEREARWAHLLCGEVAGTGGGVDRDAGTGTGAAGHGEDGPASHGAGLTAQVTDLGAEVAALRSELATVRSELAAVRAELTALQDGYAAWQQAAGRSAGG